MIYDVDCKLTWSYVKEQEQKLINLLYMIVDSHDFWEPSHPDERRKQLAEVLRESGFDVTDRGTLRR